MKLSGVVAGLEGVGMKTAGFTAVHSHGIKLQCNSLRSCLVGARIKSWRCLQNKQLLL
jgi:hypothetical protein